MKTSVLSSSTALQLLCDLIAIPSDNPGRFELRAAQVMHQLMMDASIASELVVMPDTDNQRACVVAHIPGAHADVPGLMFTGHLDVVPVPEEELDRWTINDKLIDPYQGTIIDNRLYGRGSTDMKSGLMAAALACIRLAHLNLTPHRDIWLVMTCDEEDGMIGSHTLVNQQHTCVTSCSEVVVCEPTNLSVVCKSRGRIYGTITVPGDACHGSLPGCGKNAITQATSLIHELMDHRFTYPGCIPGTATHWQPVAIHAQQDPCVVPQVAHITWDTRLSTGDSCDDALQVLRSYLDSYQASFEVIDSREPYETPQGLPVVQLARRARDYVLGTDTQRLEMTCFPGSTDGNVFAAQGIAPVICGPGLLDLAHKQLEYVLVDEYLSAIDMYAYMMLNDEQAFEDYQRHTRL